MARSTFGGFGGDQVSLDPVGNSGFYKAAANLPATGTFWSASTGGTQYTDLVDPGTGVALAGVSTDAHGHVVPFKGPDGIIEGWVDFGNGRFKLTATDSGIFLSQGTADGRYVPGVTTATGWQTSNAIAIILGGRINGADIADDTSTGTILNPGSSQYNNVIGGDGSATVGTTTPNVKTTGTNASVSVLGGYDNVAGAISSKIISDHSYTAIGSPGHNGIYGGAGHKATVNASFSMVSSGQNNTADAAYAWVTGLGNTVSGTGGAAFGNASTVTGTYGLTQGNTNTVTGAYGRAQGQLCQVDKNWGSAEGQYAYSRNGSQRTVAAGRISVTGDAQTSVTPFMVQTTDATEKKMSPGTGLPDWVMVRGQTVMVECMFTARTAGGASQGAWIVKTVCAWDATGASFNLGSATVETLYSANAGLAVRVDAVSSVGAILPKVTGLAATTINWSARMTTVEVMA